MATKLKTVSVRLNDQASARVDRVARLLRQSRGAFLAQAGDDAAQRALLDWAAHQYREEAASLSELAAELQLPLEAIARHVIGSGMKEASALYLSSCRKLAETFDMPDFYTRAQIALQLVEEENHPSAASPTPAATATPSGPTTTPKPTNTPRPPR